METRLKHQEVIETVLRAVFLMSNLLFASSVMLYVSYALDSVPIVRSTLNFLGSSMPFIPAFFGIAGILAGVLGMISLVIYFSARFKGRSLNTSAKKIWLPVIYGIITAVYIALGVSLER
jgi:hypothetical protein